MRRAPAPPRRRAAPPLAALALAVPLLAACAPAVRPAGPPVAAPRLEGEAAVMTDGARLPGRVWAPPPGTPVRGVVLALHGFNESRNFLAEPAPALAGAGLLVRAFDQRGFGAAPHRGVWPGAATLAADAAALAGLLRAAHPGVPLVWLGESMGAAVALLGTAAADPPPADRVVLLAPALRGRATMGAVERGLLETAAHTIPLVAFPGTAGGLRASDNEAALARLSRDPLTIRETRVDAVHGLVGLMDAAALALPACCRGRDAAGRVRPVPVLALHGGRDRLVPPGAARAALRSLAAGGVPGERREGGGTVAYYPEGWHLLLRDRAAGAVVADLLAWIADPASPLPSGAGAAGAAWVAEGAVSPAPPG